MLEPVPTLPELEKRGLAIVAERSRTTSEPTHYRATEEGQALIDGAMRRNAAWLREHPAEAAELTTASIQAVRAAGGTAATKKTSKKK